MSPMMAGHHLSARSQGERPLLSSCQSVSCTGLLDLVLRESSVGIIRPLLKPFCLKACDLRSRFRHLYGKRPWVSLLNLGVGIKRVLISHLKAGFFCVRWSHAIDD